VIACLIMLPLNASFAQTNSSIYLKDGSNFDFEIATNFTNDSLSLLFKDQTKMRLSVLEI